jgi:hypothetical protein
VGFFVTGKSEESLVKFGNRDIDEMISEIEEEEDGLLLMLQEEYAMSQYYSREIDKFHTEHAEYIESKQKKNYGSELPLQLIWNKDEQLLSLEEKEMLGKMKRLLQIREDAIELEKRNEEEYEYESQRLHEFPHWIRRNPKLHQRYLEVHKMMNENVMQFSDSIFFPLPDKDYNPNIVEDELEAMEGRSIEQITEDYDREFRKLEKMGEVADRSLVEKNEDYIKKTQLMGEVMNRISVKIENEHKNFLQNHRIPSEGKLLVTHKTSLIFS